MLFIYISRLLRRFTPCHPWSFQYHASNNNYHWLSISILVTALMAIFSIFIIAIFNNIITLILSRYAITTNHQQQIREIAREVGLRNHHTEEWGLKWWMIGDRSGNEDRHQHRGNDRSNEWGQNVGMWGEQQIEIQIEICNVNVTGTYTRNVINNLNVTNNVTDRISTNNKSRPNVAQMYLGARVTGNVVWTSLNRGRRTLIWGIASGLNDTWLNSSPQWITTSQYQYFNNIIIAWVIYYRLLGIATRPLIYQYQ